MGELSERLASLSPAQRELLARRLEQSAAPSASSARLTSNDAADDYRPRGGAMRFSLLFFSDDGSKPGGDKYRLLIEAAKFADEHGFAAVWTPERHFQDFGGLYPNPSVVSAALATVTRRVQIRAGSVALPLHHPARVAEEWSVVDNLSGGRVGVSFASGWHPNDFVLAPDNYERRKEIMFRDIEVVRRLWAGESLRLPGVGGGEVEVRVLPRPVQERLPVWVTSSGSADTWLRAAEVGANILTGLKGDPSQELARTISLYRQALARHGHDPRAGQVSVMLQTFVGEDTEAVRAKVRGPLTRYLRTFIRQGEHLKAEAFGVDARRVAEGDTGDLAAFAFERFFNTSALLGSPQKCARLVDRLREAGVDEVACLVDFGLDADTVLEGLRHLKALKEHYC